MKKITIIIPLLLLAVQLVAKSPVNDFVNNQILENANISLLVTDLKTNKTLYQHRPKSSTIPASTMKVVTTTTALELLGPDFRFQTTLEIDGKVNGDSVLYGNLYIRGGGDPTLGSSRMGDADFLTKWAAAVKQAGIRKIKGRIVADSGLYDNEGINPRWTWEDIGNYYAAGSYGISYLDNTYGLVLRSGKTGSTPEILRTIPEIPALTFENYLLSTGISFDSAYFSGAPHSNLRSITGEIPANRSAFTIKGDIPNPGLLLANHLHNKLIQNGISIWESPTDKAALTNKRKVIYTHTSPPLSEIVKETNVKSNNHYAEQIFRYLALQSKPVASSKGAVQVIKSFWKSKGLPVDQLFMYDGSGLSPVDAVSAQFFVELLTYMRTKSTNQTAFLNSLPVSGESGTLSSFLERTPLQGKVRAKSGTISRVKCYAGYIDIKGKSYVFAILVNNAAGSSKVVTKKIEEFLLAITKN